MTSETTQTPLESVEGPSKVLARSEEAAREEVVATTLRRKLSSLGRLVTGGHLLVILTVVGSLASLVSLWPLFSPALRQELFPAPFNAKGAPDRSSIDLTNRRSPKDLNCFLELRDAGPQARKKAE